MYTDSRQVLKQNFPITSLPADADGSGYITKEEVTSILSIFFKLSASSSNMPMNERLKDAVAAFFRIFDSNGNGIIEQFELSEIFSDVITGIANTIAALIDHFEPFILKAWISIPA